MTHSLGQATKVCAKWAVAEEILCDSNCCRSETILIIINMGFVLNTYTKNARQTPEVNKTLSLLRLASSLNNIKKPVSWSAGTAHIYPS